MTQWERSPRGLCGSLWPWKPSLVSGPQGGPAVGAKEDIEERDQRGLSQCRRLIYHQLRRLTRGFCDSSEQSLTVNTCIVCVRLAQSWNVSSSYVHSSDLSIIEFEGFINAFKPEAFNKCKKDPLSWAWLIKSKALQNVYIEVGQVEVEVEVEVEVGQVEEESWGRTGQDWPVCDTWGRSHPLRLGATDVTASLTLLHGHTYGKVETCAMTPPVDWNTHTQWQKGNVAHYVLCENLKVWYGIRVGAHCSIAQKVWLKFKAYTIMLQLKQPKSSIRKNPPI